MHGTSLVQNWFPGLVFLLIVSKDLQLIVFITILLMTSFPLLKQYTNPLLLSHNYLSPEYSDLYCLQIIFEKKTQRKEHYLKVSLPGIECYEQYKKSRKLIVNCKGIVKQVCSEDGHTWSRVLSYRLLLRSRWHGNSSHQFCITSQARGGCS